MRAVLCVLVLVCACAKTPPAVQPTTIEVVRTETVDRPVYVKTPLPTELLEAFSRLVLPVFVSPTDPNASSALTPEGERVWLAFLEQVKAIRRALEAHAAP